MLEAVGQAELGFLGAPAVAVLCYWDHGCRQCSVTGMIRAGGAEILGALGWAVLCYWEHWNHQDRQCWVTGSAPGCSPPRAPPRVVSLLCYGSWTPHLAAPPRCLVAEATAACKHIMAPSGSAWFCSAQGGGPCRGGGVCFPSLHGEVVPTSPDAQRVADVRTSCPSSAAFCSAAGRCVLELPAVQPTGAVATP